MQPFKHQSRSLSATLLVMILTACGGAGSSTENDNTLQQVDSDNDGVVDSRDAFPNNPNESIDSDYDGIGDNTDYYPNDPSKHEAPIIDSTPPNLQEVTPIGSIKSPTPSYTFSSTEEGSISITGSCSTNTVQATEGLNTIQLNTLDAGTYSDCNIFVTDISGNKSFSLAITTFEVLDYTAPTVSISGGNYHIHTLNHSRILTTNEAGTLTVSGGCSSSTQDIAEGTNAIEVTVPNYGTFSNCEIKVTDSENNVSDKVWIYKFSVTPEQVTTVIWRNENQTLIDFPSDINGFIFESSSDKNCDNVNYSACQNYNKTILEGEKIVDPNQTINDFEGVYKLASAENGVAEFSFLLSDFNDYNPQYSGSIDTSIVSFNGELLSLFGSDNAVNNRRTYNQSVWKSTNGQDWIEAPIDTIPTRSAQTTIEFNNKLWAIQGHYKVDLYDQKLYRSDVYSSEDGISWTYASEGPQPARSYHNSFVLNNKLWVIGGINKESISSVSYLTDIWSTPDGINWTKESDSSNLPWDAQQDGSYIVFDGYVWNFHEKIWRSQNGTTWSEVIPSTQYSYNQYVPRPVIEYNGMLLMFGGENAQDIWASANGYSWSTYGTLPYIGNREGGIPVILDNNIFVLEAGDGFTLKSENGINWYRGYLGWFNF